MDWRTYFERKWDHRPDIPWRLGVFEEPHLRECLIASLQKFQLGDAGAGDYVKSLAAQTGDADYLRAIEHCLAEDHQHAQWMGWILERMGAGPLPDHWTLRAFVRLRRCGGLTAELMVFLVAEVIGKRFFRILYESTSDPLLQCVFAEITCDEIGHIAFHIDTLRRRLHGASRLQRGAVRLTWAAVFHLALTAVIVDHRATLRATRTSMREFWTSTRILFAMAQARVFTADALPVAGRRMGHPAMPRVSAT